MRISYHNRRIKILFVFILFIILIISLFEIVSRFSANIVEKFLHHRYRAFSFQISKCKYVPFKGLTLLGVGVKKGGQMILEAEKIILNRVFQERVILELVSVRFSPGVFKFLPLGSGSGSDKAWDIFINGGYVGKDLRISDGFISLKSGKINFSLNANYRFWDLNFKGYFANQGIFALTSSGLKANALGIYLPDDGRFNGRLEFKEKTYPLSFILQTSPEIIIEDIAINGFKIRGPLKLTQLNNLITEWSLNIGNLNLGGKLQFENRPRESQLCLRVDKTKISGIELLTNIYCTYFKPERILELKTVGSVVNLKPFPELSVRMRFLPQGVSVEDLQYQAGFTLSGFLSYSGELTLEGKFDNFSLSELLDVFFPRYQRVLSLSGINGQLLYFSFDSSRVTELYWEIPEGKVGDIDFTEGKLHLVGKGSSLEFIDSQLMVNQTPYILEGKVDFSKFPSSEMWKNVYLVSSSPAVPFGKLGFERNFEERRISLGAKLSEMVRLDYNVEFSEQGDYNKNEVSLEIKGTPNLKLRLRGDEEIMGVEKKIEF
jgi:hypothetical protein